MSGLADRMAATQTQVHGPPCAMAAVFAVLDGTDTEALTDALADRHITARQIVDALAPEHVVSIQVVGRHRRRDCRCDRV